jgi:ABC-2 type transport system ATP-binding protein
MAMSQSQLLLNNIRTGYGGDPVIADLSLTIASGSFIGLLGPNGAGKSTLLLTIGGQFRPDAGRITYAGKDIYENNLWFKRKTGYVHESPFLYPRLTVTEFLRFVGGVKGVPKPGLSEVITRLLKDCQLEAQSMKLCAELSMGMRKKVLIAAALLGEPELVLLDEALNGVDFESAYHIKALLSNFVKRGGTVILSTHVLEVVEKLCDRYLILQDGRLAADLDAEALAKATETPDARGLEAYLIDILKRRRNP